MTAVLIAVTVAAVLAYFTVVFVSSVGFGLVTWWSTARRVRARRIAEEARHLSDRWVPPLSLAILPSDDEQEVVETVRSAVDLKFPGLEVIVVVDGRRASLVSTLVGTFQMERVFRVYRHETRCARIRGVYVSRVHPGLVLVDKPDAGSADALNAALNMAGNPLFASIVGGTTLAAGPLYRMLEDFVQAPPTVAAVVAPVRIQVPGADGLLNELARFELSLPPEPGWSALAASASGAGAFVVYRKRSLELVGGFRVRGRTPGVEMCFRLVDELRTWGQRAEVCAWPVPVAWLGHGATQRRIRSHQAGLLLTLGRHGFKLLREGPVSARVAVAYLAIAEAIAPVLELAAYVAWPLLHVVGAVDLPTFLAGVALMFGAPVARAGLSALAECTNRELFPDTDEVMRRFIAVALAPIGMRQFATWCRAIALVDAFRASRRMRRVRWASMHMLTPADVPRPVEAQGSQMSVPATPEPNLPVVGEAPIIRLSQPNAANPFARLEAAASASAPPRPAPPAPHAAPARATDSTKAPPPPLTWQDPTTRRDTRRESRPLPPPPPVPAAIARMAARVPVPPPMERPTAPPPVPVARPIPAPLPLGAPGAPSSTPPPVPAPAPAAGIAAPVVPASATSTPQIPAMAPQAAAGAPARVSGQHGPITFDVVTHYQIRADVPPGSMPALQIPSGQGGNIVLTTQQGATALPATPPTPAPPVLGAPPPAMPAVAPDVSLTPRSNRGHRRVRKDKPAPPPQAAPPPAPEKKPSQRKTEKLPAPEPPTGPIERRRTLPPIPDLPSPLENPPLGGPAEPPPLAPPPPAPASPELRVPPGGDRPGDETTGITSIPDIADDLIDLSDPKRSTRRDREGTDVDMPAVDADAVASDPIDLSAIEAPAVADPNSETSELPAIDTEQPISSEPIDLSEIVAEVEDLEETARREASDHDTSAVLPAVHGELSEPLDLGALDSDLAPGESEPDLLLPGDTDEESGGSGDTSAVLPAVPGGEVASDPLDLDAEGLSSVDATAAHDAGLALEPLDPGEISRCMQAISQSPIFYGVQATDRNRILPFLRAVTLKPGQDVIHEGDPGRGLFLLMSGACEVVQHDDHGSERRLAALKPGDCLGEMSLLTGDPASATVRATEETRLLAITPEEFPKLTEALPWLGITLARLIAQRLARTSAGVVDELKKGLFGRIELIPPSALVQAINVNMQSGLLVVQSGRQSFTGYFQDGQLWEAETEELEGEQAFYEFLTWSSGSFRFEPQKRENAPKCVASETTGLLLEGLRRIDETRRLSGERPSVKLPSLTKQTGKREAVRHMEPFALTDIESASRALGRLSLFSGLRDEQLKAVIGCMQEVQALLGDCIIRQGQEGQALYIVSSGAFDVVRKNSEGREEKLATLGPGDCFGEISLITGEAATATVSVREEGSLLVIPRDDLFQLLGRIPALGASLARILAARLAKASRWLKEQHEVIVGRLESMPPTELVQALNVNRQGGSLVVQHESKSMEIDFVDGEVMDVRLEDLRGDEAFFILLTWTTGAFRFTPGNPETTRTVKSDTMGLLFRGLRRLERARLKREEIETRSRNAVPMKSEPSVQLPPPPESLAPAVPMAAAPGGTLEAVELDLRDIKAIQESTREVGVIPLEPLEPGDIRRGLEALAQSPVFYGVQAADRNRILPYLRTAYVEADQDVLLEGKAGRGLFVVMSGEFDVVQKGEGGVERTLATLAVGECFGEMSMLTGEAASATVRARVESRVLAIAREDFAAVVRALPWLGLALARLLAERLMRTSVELQQELNKGLVGRLELVNAVALVQAINVNSQSGVLTVEGGGATFTGYFQDGQLFEAQLGDRSGEEALFGMVPWPSGTFRFEPQRRENAQRRVGTDTIGLLLEAMRRSDESKVHTRPHTGSTSTSMRKAQESTATKALPRLENESAATEALHKLSLFSGVRRDRMSEILAVMIERVATGGDVVVRQGQLGQALYLIASGDFDVVQRDAAGVQAKLASLGPGECFGELALITGVPTEATVTAKSDGHLFVIPREEFVQLLGRIPELGASLARILASRLAKASRWIQDQVQNGIFGRLESMPAMELVQALHVNGQSGTLVVQSENKTAEVYYLDGEIQDAKLDDQRGDEAFFKMLTWTAGAFRFEPGQPPVERTVKSDTVGLLFRGLRRLERARAKAAEEARGQVVQAPGPTRDPESRGRVRGRPKPGEGGGA